MILKEEDTVPCNLEQKFDHVDNLLGLSEKNDPMDNLDYEPEDPLMDEIASTIKDPWIDQDKDAVSVTKTFKKDSILSNMFCYCCKMNWEPWEIFYCNIFHNSVTGSSCLISSSEPLLRYACVVRNLVPSLIENNSDFILKKEDGQRDSCWRCHDQKSCHETKIQSPVKFPILPYFILFISYLLEVEDWSHNQSKTSTCPILFNIFSLSLQKDAVIRVIY